MRVNQVCLEKSTEHMFLLQLRIKRPNQMQKVTSEFLLPKVYKRYLNTSTEPVPVPSALICAIFYIWDANIVTWPPARVWAFTEALIKFVTSAILSQAARLLWIWMSIALNLERLCPCSSSPLTLIFQVDSFHSFFSSLWPQQHHHRRFVNTTANAVITHTAQLPFLSFECHTFFYVIFSLIHSSVWREDWCIFQFFSSFF